jgi:outer membrane protein assembly factor BamB
MISRSLKSCALAMTVAVAVCLLASAWQALCNDQDPPVRSDWPQWRGPNRNGISAEKGCFTQWPEGGPKRLWHASVGVGFSSVAVSGGRVYTMGNSEDVDTVYCLDAGSGAVVWKYPYPCKARGANPGPRATPTVDGDVVYTFGGEGHVHCLDAASGKLIWRRNVQKSLKNDVLKWGMSSSPLVEGRLLLLSAGTCGVALEKATGRIVWHVESDMPSYASPVVFGSKGRRCALFMAGGEIVCTRSRDGAALWRHPWRPKFPNNCADPIVSGDKVFVSSSYGQGCALLRIGRDRPTVLWQNERMANHFSTCVLWQGHLYGFDGDVRHGVFLKCLSFETGDPKWAEPINGSLILADGKLIILTTEGELAIAEASPAAYRELARAQVLKGKCWTGPVLAGGRIYCRSWQGDLVCLDVSGK